MGQLETIGEASAPVVSARQKRSRLKVNAGRPTADWAVAKLHEAEGGRGMITNPNQIDALVALRGEYPSITACHRAWGAELEEVRALFGGNRW